VVVSAAAASAQTRPALSLRNQPDSFINQQRAVEERLREQFEQEPGSSQRMLFDWGGWYNLNGFLFDDGVESSRTLRRHDLRLWGRLSVDEGAHEIYARTRLSLLDFNSGDSYDGNDDDVEGPNLERGLYRFDLARAMRAYRNQSIDYNLVLVLGRDLVQVGTGLALAAPLDHARLTATFHAWELSLFGGRTVGSIEDFDVTRPTERTRRNFYGGQVSYLGLDRHQPYLYVLRQEDRNHDHLFPIFQRFEYDSFYLGLGSAGEMAENLRYATEWIYETGDSFGHRQFIHRNDIQAWAAMAELEYLFRGPRNARTSIEYLFASGDGGRFASPTDAFGGNTGDYEDTGFVALGYHDTGLSFAPRYSNLHMGRAGASLFPWPENNRFRGLEVGTDWYLYWKHHRDGAVSDPTADKRSGYLGWEMDYYLNWQVASDLAWTARVGAFFPGKSFSDRSVRTFVLIGMTYSF
jgi:hypothetical protein